MNKVEFTLNRAGVRQLLTSAEVQADLLRRAAAVAEAATAAGGTYGHDVRVGQNRARARVWAADFPARVAEAKHRALTRAIDAAR